jgi:hypothetical protein
MSVVFFQYSFYDRNITVIGDRVLGGWGGEGGGRGEGEGEGGGGGGIAWHHDFSIVLLPHRHLRNSTRVPYSTYTILAS